MTLVRPIDGNALIEKIDKIDWYHVNEDGKLVSGAKNVSEAYFPALDIYDAVEYMPTIDAIPVEQVARIITRVTSKMPCDIADEMCPRENGKCAESACWEYAIKEGWLDD